jgi:predicted amidohydrolase YtcJ
MSTVKMGCDLALLNGNIVTMDRKRKRAEAVAVAGERIIGVGKNSGIKRLIGKNTEVINLRGRTIVPGMIDSHIHFVDYGLSLKRIDLRNVRSIVEVQKKVASEVKVTPAGKWIVGRSWDQERLREKRYPNRYDLDKVSPENPVVLSRVCGHICVVNSQALQLANITKQTTDPQGGQIDKDPETGEPTGILRDEAMSLVWRCVPEPTKSELVAAIEAASRKALSAGLTSVHVLLRNSMCIEALQEARATGKLGVRVYMGIPVELLDDLIHLGLKTGFGDNWLKIGCVKMLLDGSLGGRTAALKEPYADDPGNKGLLLYREDELRQLIDKAHDSHCQLAIHAIGDHAIDLALDAIEEAQNKTPRENPRHRIEHASIINQQQIDKMTRLGVIASVQPAFVTSDFWAIDRVGKPRESWIYPFKTLFKKVVASAGSDCPVEHLDPLEGIWAATTRGGFLPAELLSVDQVLHMYTVNGAYASFEENEKGSISEGKLADMIVLSRDPFEVPSNELKSIKVETVIVGGKVIKPDRP